MDKAAVHTDLPIESITWILLHYFPPETDDDAVLYV